jgi:hypothetical protein
MDTTSVVGLPGVEILTESCFEDPPRGPFRPVDPINEAHAQAIPTGLQQRVYEDTEGVEDERTFRRVVVTRPVVAVDCGVVLLGQTPDGVVGAARAAAVVRHPDGRIELWTYRPGIFHLNSSNRLRVLHGMGKALGRDDFYVKVQDGEPVAEKVPLNVHDHRLLDRSRNFLERLVQRQVCLTLSDAVIVFDGALTLRTWDTPGIFLRDLHDTAQARDLTLLAVAKKTGLSVRGIDIRLLLDNEGGLPGRRKLTAYLRGEGGAQSRRFLGDLFVARFAPGGETYRVDVDAAPGLTSAAALDEFFSGCLFRNGYPEPLLQAHAFSYMPPSYVAELQAFAIATLDLDVMPEPKLGPVFAPFGGRYR